VPKATELGVLFRQLNYQDKLFHTRGPAIAKLLLLALCVWNSNYLSVDELSWLQVTSETSCMSQLHDSYWSSN